VDIASLAAGQYYCELTVSDPNAWNDPQIVGVSLVISGPIIELSSQAFEFTFSVEDMNLADQILAIRNSGDGTLNWQISEDCEWLSAEPNSGSSAGETDYVTLSVNLGDLGEGGYNCEFMVSDANALNSPQVVTVTLVVGAAALILDYNAEAHAWAYEDVEHRYDYGEDYSDNGKAETWAWALGLFSALCGDGSSYSYGQNSKATVRVEGIHDYGGGWLVSALEGHGWWHSKDCWSDRVTGTGGGDGGGHTLMAGTILIRVPAGYPRGSPGLALRVEPEVMGDVPGAWDAWDWWLKIWRDGGDSPLVLNSGNTPANLSVSAGEILNFEFYNEASQNPWPDAGLESTLEVYLSVMPFGDLDDDCTVDLLDFSVFAADWHECIDACDVNYLAGDFTRDGCMDVNDLRALAYFWLEDYLASAAHSPNPADHEAGVWIEPVLRWSPGSNAEAHEVYFGTDANAVAEAGLESPEFMGTFSDPCFYSGPLECNVTYYWRIDETGPLCTAEGVVWRFTVGQPQANNPSPPDNADGVDPNIVFTLPGLAGPLAMWHDVYLGTDGNAVAEAGPDSPEFVATVSDPCFCPGPLARNWLWGK
jgi:hypothetical protein